MTRPAQKRKRRGIILSSSGLQRLQNAQEQSAITENDGYAYTLEQLSSLTIGFIILVTINQLS